MYEYEGIRRDIRSFTSIPTKTSLSSLRVILILALISIELEGISIGSPV